MNIDIVVTILVAVFASSGFWQWMMSRKLRKDDKTEALLALLHNEIYTISETAIKNKTITTEEFDNLTCLYEPYEKLGGNGTGRILYEKTKNLMNKGE